MGKLAQIGSAHGLGIAATYSALLIVLGIVLAIRVVAIRRAEKIGLGDGDNRILRRRIRAHGNFSEYAPLLMIALLVLPLLGAKEWMIHLVGLTGLVGRVLHAIGISRTGGASLPRLGGILLTFTALMIGVVLMLILAWL